MKINWDGLATFTKEKCQGGICEFPCKHSSREEALKKEFLDPTWSIQVWLVDVELNYLSLTIKGCVRELNI